MRGMKCWGRGSDGRTGYGATNTIGDGPGEMGVNLPFVDLGGQIPLQVSCGSYACCAVLDDGALSCWGGQGSNGLLGDGSGEAIGDEPMEMGIHLPTVDLGTGAAAVEVAVRSEHVCVVLRGGSVKCWGKGSLLGLGDGCVPQL